MTKNQETESVTSLRRTYDCIVCVLLREFHTFDLMRFFVIDLFSIIEEVFPEYVEGLIQN